MIVQCPNCRMLQLHPAFSEQELERFHRDDYRSPSRKGRLSPHKPEADQRGEALAKLATCFLTPGSDEVKVLEVGAGFGHNLRAIGKSVPGSALFAVEIDARCWPFLQESGIRVWRSGLRQAAQDLHHYCPFDLVLLSHVLEHWHSPRALLESVSLLLKPSGRVVLEVPNDIPRRNFDIESPVPHVVFFSKQTLKRCICDVGGHILFCDTCGPYIEGSCSDLDRYGGKEAIAMRAVFRF